MPLVDVWRAFSRGRRPARPENPWAERLARGSWMLTRMPLAAAYLVVPCFGAVWIAAGLQVMNGQVPGAGGSVWEIIAKTLLGAALASAILPPLIGRAIGRLPARDPLVADLLLTRLSGADLAAGLRATLDRWTPLALRLAAPIFCFVMVVAFHDGWVGHREYERWVMWPPRPADALPLLLAVGIGAALSYSYVAGWRYRLARGAMLGDRNPARTLWLIAATIATFGGRFLVIEILFSDHSFHDRRFEQLGPLLILASVEVCIALRRDEDLDLRWRAHEAFVLDRLRARLAGDAAPAGGDPGDIQFVIKGG